MTRTARCPDLHDALRDALRVGTCVVFASACASDAAFVDPPYVWSLPAGVEPPLEPVDNPTTMTKVELGRRLFVDTRLSATKRYSCASCHAPELAFSDRRSPSVGLYGDELPRGAPSLANVGYMMFYTWSNPLLTELESQTLVPLLAKRPAELDIADRVAEVMAELNDDPAIAGLFQQAFPVLEQPVTLVNTLRALSAYERTLVTTDSEYDRFLAGDGQALSDAAERGRRLFFSDRLRCGECHGGRWLSAATDPNRSIGDAFANTGLYNMGGSGAYPNADRGLAEFSGRAEDTGKFRIPSLRNVELTAPYMHDGSVATLDDVLDHYQQGGRTIPTGPRQGVGADSPFKDARVTGFTLDANERADLLAFLASLTDPVFIRRSVARAGTSESGSP